ncbi:hypothetical protein ACQ4PT_068772 [Festuca glaucescens]
MSNHTDIKLNVLQRPLPFFSKRRFRPREGPLRVPMKEMRNRLQAITDEAQRFSFLTYSISKVQQLSDKRETSGIMEAAQIIGRGDEKEKIMACLSRSITPITFFPIYGIGGIGKTTMAKLVFNDSQFKEYSRVWVYVSETFDLNKIGNSIVSQLSNKESRCTIIQMIHNRLQQLLSDKNVLIILDDLWEKETCQLEELKAMLNLEKACKVVVIITTRDENIAKKIGTVNPYKIVPLTDDMCWTIIKKGSSFDDRPESADKERLELIGKAVAKKCGGIALAAKSMIYKFRYMTSNELESVNNTESSEVFALEDESSPHNMDASLLLSYQIMSSCLKLCFAYCAIFPKGHKIAKRDLIHQWIALGFMESSSTFSIIQMGDIFVSHLLSISFFERSSSQNSYDHESLVMNDLVHDLARSVMADEVNLESPTCRYIGSVDCRKLLDSSRTVPAKIRALHFIEHSSLMLRGDVLSPAKCLRVLDLSSCSIKEFPDSISQLKQLRYLNAPRIHNKMMPNCISMLSKLSYLNLSGSSEMQALPDSIGEMQGLLHLDLSGCYDNIVIPKALGTLRKLQYLNLSGCRSPKGLREVISSLTELRHLNISGYAGYLEESSSTKQSFIDSIGTLPNLEHLDLSRNNYPFSIPESFSRLKELRLHGCQLVTTIPESVANKGLSGLSGFFGDMTVPDFRVHTDDSTSVSSHVWLKYTNPDALGISDLQNVRSIEEGRSIRLMEKEKIGELKLEWGRGERSFVEDIELLRELVLPPTPKILKLFGYNNVSFPHWIMGIGSYLTNLVSLDMWNLPCSSLPSLFQLPNLRKISLRRMPNLEEFNTTCSTGEDGENELTLPKLEYLHMYYCVKLRIAPCPPRAAYWKIEGSDNVLPSWGDTVSHTSASSSSSLVSKLEVHSKLPMEQWRLLHHLPGLSDLAISGCHDLTSSPQITRCLTSLESLSLKYGRMRKLPEWLGELTSLRQLHLRGIGNLEGLHGNMGKLTQLQSLSLWRCVTLTSLPEWLGESTYIKKLDIESCEGIRSLPESVLTNLQELNIQGNPGLYDWCNLAENRLKLAHIKEKVHWRRII